MRKRISILYLFILTCFSGYTQNQPAERYVVLISIDAFKPEFYLDSNWYAPTLKRLMREGVCAEGVKPVFPSVTYPNHISMITGALPARHGIFYNSPPQGSKRWNATMIKSPTIFDAVHASGRSTSALFWPVTAESAIQYNVPAAPGMKRMKAAGFKSVDFMNSTASPDLWEELEQNVIGKVTVADIDNDVNTGKMAAYIIRTHKPTLTAIHLTGIDHAQHRVGMKNQSVADALHIVDNAIQEIIVAIEQAGITANTTLLIAGDHGFSDVNLSLAPNVWLKKKGLYRNASRWKARFYTSNGAAFLYLKDKDDERTLRRVVRMLDNLPDDEKKMFRVIDRDELHTLGADPDAILALNPVQGIVLRQSGSGKLVRNATGGAHGYFADFPEIMTGFVGWGNGLNAGVVIPHMNVPDIAPIIARLLELDFESQDGQVNEELFKN